MESKRQVDRNLLEGFSAFVLGLPHPDVRRFHDGLAHWGDDWVPVTPRRLPAAGLLEAAVALAPETTRPLIALWHSAAASCFWEQSYSAADGVVGEAMLAGYGFAELIGKNGPFVSSRLRSGIGVWGPGITYPPHRHKAEEVYIPLAGSAQFLRGEGENETRETHGAGDVVYVAPGLRHGFRTGADPLVLLYLWQNGDLREISSFT